MRKLNILVDGKDWHCFNVSDDQVEIKVKGKWFKADKKDIEVELEVFKPDKGKGYLLYSYKHKNNRSREFLLVDGYTDERLVEAIKNLDILESERILTELLQPFGYDR
ncbi:MAG: hypothetical protein KDD32_11040 [Bacteroidetes bacterium]|nr:hypothetical protein [Bacteroidota bacterium]